MAKPYYIPSEEKKKHLLELKAYIEENLKDSIIISKIENNELIVKIKKDEIANLAYFLKNDRKFRFEQLIDIAGVDYLVGDERFEVVYQFLSVSSNLRLTVKLSVKEEVLVPSICSVYTCADWFEREVWDMYGIPFENHPDLRRILTDYGFEGHPLRKDFPLSGFVELKYDEKKRKVIYKSVELEKPYRELNKLGPFQEQEVLRVSDILKEDKKD